MRVIGGTFKGRGLQAPSEGRIRPTSDRLRETIFDILAHAYADPITNAAVIDLFAGTGAMGLEALSRGARNALFVETATQSRALIRANIDALGLGGVTQIFRRDARKLGQAPALFNLAFLDPPYRQRLAEQALIALREGRWLAPDALLVVEEAADVEVLVPSGYRLLETRVYGDTRIMILGARPIAHSP